MALSNYDPGQELSSIDFSAVIGGPLTAVVDAQAKAALSTIDFIKSVGFSPDVEDEATGEITPGEPIYVTFKFPKMVQPYQPGVQGKVTDISPSNAGSGYAAGDTLTVIPNSGAAISLTITGIDSNNGSIQSVAWDTSISGYDNESALSATGGSGSGAEFDITTTDDDPVPAVFQEMKLEVPILTMVPIPFVRVEEGEIDFHAKITSMEYKRVGADFKAGVSKVININNQNQNATLASTSFNYNKNTVNVNLKTNFSYQRSMKGGHKIDKTYHLGVVVKFGQEETPEGMERLLGILEDAIVSQPIEE